MNRGSRARGTWMTRRTCPAPRRPRAATSNRMAPGGDLPRKGREDLLATPEPERDLWGRAGWPWGRPERRTLRADNSTRRTTPGNREARPDDFSWIEFVRGGTGFLEIGDDFYRFSRPRTARTSIRRETAGS